MDMSQEMPVLGWYEEGHRNSFLEEITGKADEARKLARPKRSNLYVGASVLASREVPTYFGSPHKNTEYHFYQGGNIETLWQTCEHAEKNALVIALNASLDNKIEAVCIAAERQLFTPCGDCLDMIWEFGGEDCVVLHYNPATKAVQQFKASQLMPFYPTRK